MKAEVATKSKYVVIRSISDGKQICAYPLRAQLVISDDVAHIISEFSKPTKIDAWASRFSKKNGIDKQQAIALVSGLIDKGILYPGTDEEEKNALLAKAKLNSLSKNTYRCKNPIILFLSTGRCGTQWVAKTLTKHFSPYIHSEHEPIVSSYLSRFVFRKNNHEQLLGLNPTIAAHFRNIEEIVLSKSYVEVGWPVFSWIPYFIEKYGRSVKIVHLTRNPFDYALSHVQLGYYQPGVLHGYSLFCTLDPEDNTAFGTQYSSLWGSLTPVEKNLFQWLEINHYASELKNKYNKIEFRQYRMEDIFNKSTHDLEDMLTFLGLKEGIDSVLKENQVKIDSFPTEKKAVSKYNVFNGIEKYPGIKEVAEKLGYAL